MLAQLDLSVGHSCDGSFGDNKENESDLTCDDFQRFFTIKTDHLEYRSLELWMKRLAWCWTVLVYATKRAAQVKNFGNNLEMILMR